MLVQTTYRLAPPTRSMASPLAHALVPSSATITPTIFTLCPLSGLLLPLRIVTLIWHWGCCVTCGAAVSQMPSVGSSASRDSDKWV